MMWERCATRSSAWAGRSAWRPRRPRSTSRTARRWRSPSTSGGVTERIDASHVISSMPLTSLARHRRSARSRRGAHRGRRPPLPRLPDRGPGRPRGARLPRQLDLHPLTRRQGGPDPELRRLVPVPGEGRPHLSGYGVLRLRGRRAVDVHATTSWWRWPPRSWRPSGWSTRPMSRPATWCGCPRPTRSTTTCYRANVEVIRRWFEEHAPNVHPVGRNGMHKYNNQDHSMYTAMLTVENIHGARPRHLGGERRGGVPRDHRRPLQLGHRPEPGAMRRSSPAGPPRSGT